MSGAHPQAEARRDAFGVGTIIGDHFVLTRLLGSGGMGDVYVAQHQTMPGIQSVVKVLHQQWSSNERFVAMLRAEAETQSRLHNDAVVQILDFTEQHGRYCLILDFIRGKTLSALLEESPGGLPMTRCLELICEVLRGLNYAHEQGVWHCDIKPDNIIIDDEGRGHAKITDFGIARDLRSAASDSNLESAGTPPYMSPEQVLRPADIDHRTDVYSTGVMLFEMLCGRLPFEGVTDAGECPQLTLPPPDVRSVRRDIPLEVARIVLTAMQPDRDHRFAGCGDFIAAIRRYQWRRKWRPILLGGSLAAAIIGLAIYLWSEDIKRLAQKMTEQAKQQSAQALEQSEQAQQKSAQAQEKTVQAVGDSFAAAAKTLVSLCREAGEREIKRGGLPLAIQLNDQKLIQSFTQKLKDMDDNIEALTLQYANTLDVLPDLPDPGVDRAKRMALQAVVHDEFRWATESAVSDYTARRSVTIPNASRTLLARCPPMHAIASSPAQ